MRLSAIFKYFGLLSFFLPPTAPNIAQMDLSKRVGEVLRDAGLSLRVVFLTQSGCPLVGVVGTGVVPVAGGVALAPHESVTDEALVAQVPKELVSVVPVKGWLVETASVAKGAGGVGVVHTPISG